MQIEISILKVIFVKSRDFVASRDYGRRGLGALLFCEEM